MDHKDPQDHREAVDVTVKGERMVPPDLPVHVEPQESAEWAALVDDQEVWVFQD